MLPVGNRGVTIPPMSDLERLRGFLDRLGRVLLGYSGGVDSALLAVVASRTLGPERFLAVSGLSPSYPESQREIARSLAARFAIPLVEVETRELEDPRYRLNGTDRCYFCKTELWSRLAPLARARRFDVLIDGTNVDDLSEHRPGAQAGREHGVRSPLAELGWRKVDVRRAARRLGLPIWDAPSAPCLSSRIRYGLPVTRERLRQVEQGEAFLRGLGVSGNLRVRHLGSTARVEVDPSRFPLLEARWEEVESEFERIGFSDVVRDPRGYRRGAMLTVLET